MITSTQQKQELFRTIWSIADDLRGSVDGWDFKQYILGMLFYRFISENITNYINTLQIEAGIEGFDYAAMPDDEAEQGREMIVQEKGFFIAPSDLFCNMLKEGDNPDLNQLLDDVFHRIESSAKGTASLSDLMKEHPEHRAEAKQDLQLLNAQKMGEHEAEIEKIKNVFLAILRDIKKDIDNGEQPGEAVTAAMFQAMRDALAEQKQKPLSIDDVTAMIAGQIGQLAPMDEETADLFQRLVKKMIEQAEK